MVEEAAKEEVVMVGALKVWVVKDPVGIEGGVKLFQEVIQKKLLNLFYNIMHHKSK